MTDLGGLSDDLTKYGEKVHELRSLLDSLRDRLDAVESVLNDGTHYLHLTRERDARKKAASTPPPQS